MTDTTDQEEALKEFWRPISDAPGWQWVSENVELPGDSELKNFDFELFPLARFVLEQLCGNESLRKFTEMLSAQVGKTVTILAYLCWKIINRPSGSAWYTDTGLNANGDLKTKILPMLESCEPVAKLLPSDRSKKGKTLIQFGPMNLRVMGAESKNNREGKTISEVLCDEVRNYPAGAMEQIDNRFKTVSNYRRILFSSAGDTKTEPWISFLKGTRHLGFWCCPSCQHKQTFRFGRDASPLYPEPRKCGGFIWDDNRLTHPSENVYNFVEVAKTIRYQCENPACKREFKESEKLDLIRGVKFEQTNPMPEPFHVSVHSWEAYTPFVGCSWESIVTRFLNALVSVRQGSVQPMRVFVCEVLGEPWEERGERPVEGEILKRCGDYTHGEVVAEWDKAIGQIAADVQLGFLHVNYSMFLRGGAKRTIERVKLLGPEELRLYQQSKKVADYSAGIDCAHDPSKILAACAAHGRWVKLTPEQMQGRSYPARTVKVGGEFFFWNGWVALLGDDAEEFTVNGVKTFAKGQAIDSNIGKAGGAKQVLRVNWSGPHYNHELFFVRIKGLGQPWEIPNNIAVIDNGDYVRQMQTVERRDITNAEGLIIKHEWVEKGRHDDPDTEKMQLVLADINGVTNL